MRKNPIPFISYKLSLPYFELRDPSGVLVVRCKSIKTVLDYMHVRRVVAIDKETGEKFTSIDPKAEPITDERRAELLKYTLTRNRAEK